MLSFEGVNNPATFEFEHALKSQLVGKQEFQSMAYYSDVYRWFDDVFIDFKEKSAAKPVSIGANELFIEEGPYLSHFARVVGTC